MKPPTAATADFTTREKRRIVAGFIGTAIIGVLGVWIGVANSIENGQQNAEAAAQNKTRDQQTAQLLDCFNRYTTDTNLTSKDQRPLIVAVTTAQSTVAQAQLMDSLYDRRITLAARERGVALDAVLRFAVDPNRSTDMVLGQTLVDRLIQTQGELIDAETAAVPVQRALTRAYRKYVAANDALELFRFEHPVPDPPSTTCKTND